MAAFDAALQDAGIANFNLVQLTSVIPTGAHIADFGEDRLTMSGEWGDRLYVVLAEGRADQPGDEAWAGLAWVQQDGSRKGLFTENSGTSESGVRDDITHTITSMTNRRPDEFGPVSRKMRGITCVDEPVCALVVAVFEPQAWIDTWAPPSDLEVRSVSGFGTLYP